MSDPDAPTRDFSRDNSALRSNRRRGGPSVLRDSEDHFSLLEQMQKENKNRLQSKLEVSAARSITRSPPPPETKPEEVKQETKPVEMSALSSVSSDSEHPKRQKTSSVEAKEGSLEMEPLTAGEVVEASSIIIKEEVCEAEIEKQISEVPELVVTSSVAEEEPTKESINTVPEDASPVSSSTETVESPPAAESAPPLVSTFEQEPHEIPSPVAQAPETKEETPAVVYPPTTEPTPQPKEKARRLSEEKETRKEPDPVGRTLIRRKSTLGEKEQISMVSKPKRVARSKGNEEVGASPIIRRSSTPEEPPKEARIANKKATPVRTKPKVWMAASPSAETPRVTSPEATAATSTVRVNSPPASSPRATSTKRGNTTSRGRVQSAAPVGKSSAAVAPTPVRRPVASCRPNLRTKYTDDTESKLSSSRNGVAGATEVSERRRLEAIQARKQREKAAEEERNRRMESTLRRSQTVEREDKPESKKIVLKTTNKEPSPSLDSSVHRRRKSVGANTSTTKTIVKPTPQRVNKRKEAPAPSLAPFCTECGHKHVDPNAKFCAMCGSKRAEVTVTSI